MNNFTSYKTLQALPICDPEFLAAEQSISRIFDLLASNEDFLTIRYLIHSPFCHTHNDNHLVIIIRCKIEGVKVWNVSTFNFYSRYC
jgi:hypothetical protein